MQASYSAWTGNIEYGQSRSAKAENSLDGVNNLMVRAQELLVQASSTSTGDTGRMAIASDLRGIRETLSVLLNETDYQGIPVFDDGTPTRIPVGRGIQLEAVGTRQSISEGIDVNGTPMSLDDILASAISAVESGDDAARTNALGAVETGVDHVINEQANQGIRAERLSSKAEHLTELTLSLREKRSSLRSEEHTSELQSLMRTSYAVFCLK